jgi:hypothetical protein
VREVLSSLLSSDSSMVRSTSFVCDEIYCGLEPVSLERPLALLNGFLKSFLIVFFGLLLILFIISLDLFSCFIKDFLMFVSLRFVFRFKEWLWLMALAAFSIAMAVDCMMVAVSIAFIVNLRFWVVNFCLVCSLLKCQISSVVTRRIWLRFNSISDTNAFCMSLVLSKSDRLRLLTNFNISSLESNPVMI